MFHKRLQYNYFQQFGNVDIEQLKKHVKSEAVKLAPDHDSVVPSLTDIKGLIDDYLMNKNRQDIKKLN
jgi:phage gp36-like protein